MAVPGTQTSPTKDTKTGTDIRQVLWRATTAGRHVLRWWHDELRGLIPSAVRRRFSTDPVTAQVLMDANGTDVRQVLVKRFSKRERRLEGPLDPTAALAWVGKRRRRWGSLMRVDILLPLDCCLVRQRNVPAAAADRIADVLALTIERTMPFGMADIRQAWRIMGLASASDASALAATLQVMHVVAKRRLVDPLLESARSAGVPVTKVDVIDAEGAPIGINLLSRGETPPSLAGRLNRAIAIAAVLLGVVAAGTGVVALQRQDDALAQLEAQTNTARKEAQIARKQVQDADILSERIGLLRQRRAEDIRVIALWEEVTQRLPDTAWLTDLRVENDTISINGYARSASELVGMIAASPMFSGVALSAPVVREAGRASERFQIRMKIENAAAAGIHKAEAP